MILKKKTEEQLKKELEELLKKKKKAEARAKLIDEIDKVKLEIQQSKRYLPIRDKILKAGKGLKDVGKALGKAMTTQVNDKPKEGEKPKRSIWNVNP